MDSVTGKLVGANKLGSIWMQLRQRELPDRPSKKRPSEEQAAGAAPEGHRKHKSPKQSLKTPRNSSKEPFASRYAITFGEVSPCVYIDLV